MQNSLITRALEAHKTTAESQKNAHEEAKADFTAKAHAEVKLIVGRILGVEITPENYKLSIYCTNRKFSFFASIEIEGVNFHISSTNIGYAGYLDAVIPGLYGQHLIRNVAELGALVEKRDAEAAKNAAVAK